MLSSFITLNDWLHTKAIHSTSCWPRTQQIHRWLSIYCSSIIVQSAVTYYFIKISQRPNASTNAGFERNSMPIQWHKTLNGRKVLENRCSFVDAGFKFLAPRGRFLADCGLSFDVIWNQLPSSSLADVKPSSKKGPCSDDGCETLDWHWHLCLLSCRGRMRLSHPGSVHTLDKVHIRSLSLSWFSRRSQFCRPISAHSCCHQLLL